LAGWLAAFGVGVEIVRSKTAAAVVKVSMVSLIGLFALYLVRTPAVGTSRSLSWAVVVFAVVIIVLRGVARRVR
jgi:hypothetical protein